MPWRLSATYLYFMRPLLLLIAVLLVFSRSVQAQTGFGIEGGIGMCSMKFAPPTYPILYTAASTGALVSGKLGALADIPMNKHLYFQAGLSVSRRGAVRDFSYYRNDSFNETIHQTLSMFYGDMPLSVVYKTGIQGKGRFVIGIGATFSYLLAGTSKISDYAVNRDTATNYSGTDKLVAGQLIHAFDLGLNLSAGYEMPTGWFFKVYYTMGVNDIAVGTEIDKNRIWGVSAGYFFGKKRNVNKEADDLIDHTP